MAVLQAARAQKLGLPLESAYSWGLNRAIFIAAAKRGFKAGSPSGGTGSGGKSDDSGYFLGGGDDMAYKVKKGGVLLFTIGGKVQTKDEFEARVKSRFGKYFPKAWAEAVAYVRTFDKETLESREGFFRDVYRPVRDSLADKWTQASASSS